MNTCKYTMLLCIAFSFNFVSCIQNDSCLLSTEQKQSVKPPLKDILEQIPFNVALWQTWWILLVLLTIVFIVIGFHFYGRIIRKKEKNRLKQFRRVIALKIQTLQHQLDPHFIFNSLNSIQSYILEENSEKALEYLSDFSMILRTNIENANKEFISLSDELFQLQHYLKLEQMRFSDKFSSHISVDPNINIHNIKLPPMLIQPFLGNAIKYGLSGMEKKGILLVEFHQEEDGFLKCIIEDNGIGREMSRSLHEGGNIKVHHKSLRITKDRIKLLNKAFKNGRMFTYFIEDLFDENNLPCGTRIELGFPKVHSNKT